ncbi:MAG: cobalt ECF transporter T component CbiQ [Planctomycetota bacterium]|nr:cobalt ECF transporter T component CbiQ [Planctomycetota bacterium]
MKDTLFDQQASPDNFIHSLDPRTKILTLFPLIFVSTSTPPQFLLSFGLYSLYLIVLTALARIPIKLLIKRFLMALPFILMVSAYLPFVEQQDLSNPYSGGWWLFWNMVIKAFIGIYAMSVLTATTRFAKLIQGFARLRAPQLLLMLLSFTYRYMFVLVEEAQRMKRARDARAYGGRWLWQAKVIGQMIGTLFLRSYERGERVYLAMCSRGYDGTQSLWQNSSEALGRRDYAFALSSISVFILARWGVVI